MWKMYSHPTEGVRIRLRENPFKVFDFCNGGFRELSDNEEMLDNGLKPFCSVVSPFDNSEYKVRNPLYETQLIEVKYSDDKSLLFPDIINRNEDYVLDGSKMGVTKNIHWAFQKEIRYRIITYIDDLDNKIRYLKRYIDDTEPIDTIMRGYIGRLPKYIDLHLSDLAVENMQIMVAPDFSDSNMVLLHTLKEKYAPLAQIIESSLTNIVRMKA